MNARILALVSALAVVLGCTAGCGPKPCDGHRELRPTSTMHYRIDSKGHLKPDGYRPGVVEVCARDRHPVAPATGPTAKPTTHKNRKHSTRRGGQR